MMSAALVAQAQGPTTTENFEMTREHVLQVVDTAGLVVAAIGALFVWTRMHFRRMTASVTATQGQVQNGHGDGPTLRQDLDAVLAMGERLEAQNLSIMATQEQGRSDFVALRTRVDSGFAELRGDIRYFRGRDEELREHDGDLSRRVRRLETASPQS
jgi:hypothetical protein